ncbi:hypothetical protein BGW37DRAFT_474446 [Umbelopsis sp. PMI_123]|nr:hypothetical protein BGW37DRAFT_474446 [Umbelopsis sp. PMI_123]
MSTPITNANSENQSQPSQIVGNIKQYAGLAEETIGNALGSQAWTDAGKQLKEDGIQEIQKAKETVAHAPPNKTNANINSVVGAVKEEVGNLLGNSNVANSGAEQRQAGHTEYEAAKAGDYLEGAGNVIRGKVEGTVGKIVGDEDAQARAQNMELDGKKAMQLNEPK